MPFFVELLSNPQLIQNLEESNLFEATEIQSRAIPEVKKGRDLFALAQTGTGKTAAFCLPLIEKLLTKTSSGASVLILTPTRELCLQTHDVIVKFSKGSSIKVSAIYGGVKQAYQAEEISLGVNFIVATPGRLVDLLKKNLISLSEIEVLILDEADRMLDMGFTDDLNFILKNISKERQTLMFSATLAEKMKELAKVLLKDPVHIEVTPNNSVSEKISQFVSFCEPNFKLQKLKDIIMNEAFGSVLVFTNTKTAADEVALFLNRNGIECKAIHSDKKQAEREKSILQFSQSKINLLVATDLVARGIDVENVTLVINYEMPFDAETYVHRVGRTGRVERTGKAYSLCAKAEMKYYKAIVDLVGSIEEVGKA